MRPNSPRNQAQGNTALPFFIALFAGIASIILLKIVGADQIVVTAVPVGIMFLYAGFVYFFRRLRIRLDQAGDNLYYLGFLYTLTSLAYSLVEFGRNDTGATSIITNFGVAIATTITGLGLRVAFSQMRVDPVETEQLARVELADASRHLRTELDSSAREFVMFRRSLQQMIEETFQELQETVDKTMQGGMSRFEGSVERFASAVADANRGFEGRADALKSSADALVGNISTLAERIQSVEVSDDLLLRKLQPAIDNIDVSAKRLNTTVTDLSGRISTVSFPDDLFVNKLQPAIDKITEVAEVSRNSARMDSVRAESWANLAGEVSTVIDDIQNSLKGAQAPSAMFKDGANSIRSAAEQMSILAERMGAVESKLGSISETTDREFKRVFETVIRNMDGLIQQLFSQANNIGNTDSGQPVEGIPFHLAPQFSGSATSEHPRSGGGENKVSSQNERSATEIPASSPLPSSEDGPSGQNRDRNKESAPRKRGLIRHFLSTRSEN